MDEFKIPELPFPKNLKKIMDEYKEEFESPFGIEYGITCNNVYINLHGLICARKNPTPGLYIYDGQVFYKAKQKQPLWTN